MKKHITLTRVFLFAMAMLSWAFAANATVAIAPIFGANMVLQRGKPIPVPGTASPNKTITVTFNGQTKTTTSDSMGNWQVSLDAMDANTTGGSLSATEAGANTVTLSNILVGDVWICGGQSNMDMSLGSCNRQIDIDTANYPVMRSCRAPLVSSDVPLKTISANWLVCNPTNASSFSAASFYFARKICMDQNSAIPIGLYVSSVGGTTIDKWLAPDGATDIPVLAPLYSMSIMPSGPFSLFNGMVYPYSPLPAKGMIWYQGENAESSTQSADSYYLKMKTIAQGYKRMLGLDDFAFYCVQLAYWGAQSTSAAPVLTSGGWDADTRIQQANAMALPHAGMASAMDVGSSLDGDQIWDGWHPKDKKDVGERLALWALKNDYGRQIPTTSGPVLRDVAIDPNATNTVVCTFDNIGDGLMVGSKAWYSPTVEVVGGTLQKFSIADAAGNWQYATATISGNTVRLSAPSISAPRKVAYACWQNPVGANLYNKVTIDGVPDGLPASPFYVDDITAKYTVTATPGAGGSITPAGPTTFLKRAAALYTITPSAGYYTTDVKVDNVSVGALKYYTFDPLYANHTITASFATTAPSFAVTASSNAGGSLTPSGAVSVAQGGSQTFSIMPDAGKQLALAIDGKPMGPRTSYTFADVRSPHTISATFSCVISAQAGYGGRISPSGDTLVSCGSSKTFTITPMTGCTIGNVKVDGVGVGAVSSYTFSNVTDNHTIVATFVGGATTGSIPQPSQLLFSALTDALPAGGSTISGWASYSPSGRTFSSIGSPTVEMVDGKKFEKNLYANGNGFDVATYSSPIPCTGATIVVVAKPVINGYNAPWTSIVDIFYDRIRLGIRSDTGKVCVCRNNTTEDSSTPIPDGQTTILSMVVQATGEYKVFANGTMIINNASTSTMTSLVPSSFNQIKIGRGVDSWSTFTGDIGDVFCYTTALSDTDRQQLEGYISGRLLSDGVQYTVTASADTGGTISPSGAVLVSSGGSQAFTITPNYGYSIADVKVDNVSVGAVSSYTLTNIKANHSIAASFTALPTYTISASADTGGSISPSGSVVVVQGGSKTFTITPNTGYTIAGVSVDGVAQGAISSYTFSGVTSNRSIRATFNAIPSYTITASADTGGTISPSGAVTVYLGASQTFAITPNSGYAVKDVSVDGASQGAITSYTFSNISKSSNIYAAFRALPKASISGTVTDNNTSAPISAATVYFAKTPNAADNAVYTTTTDLNGNYTKDVEAESTWYVSVEKTGYTTSQDAAVTLALANVGNINFALSVAARNIPLKDQLLFSAIADTFPSSGATGSWDSYYPAGEKWTTIGSPTVQTINGAKWEQNLYTDGDGFTQGTYSTPIPVNGATIVTAVKPIMTVTTHDWDWRSIVDVFYNRLVVGVCSWNGKVCARRNGSLEWSTTAIPDGQITVLSMVVQPTGQYKVYANGSLMLENTSTSDMTSLVPNVPGSYANHIYVGRGVDGWSTFNGNIGDVFVYKTALLDADRQTLEADVAKTFIKYTITTQTGAGGTISPSGSMMVGSGANQAFTMIPDPGYAVADVKVDGVSKGALNSFTFSKVSANHTISASFVLAARPVGVNNKDALTDTKLAGRVVKVWGKVISTTNLPTSFVISDGYNSAGVVVNVNGAALPSGFGTNKTAVVTGVLGADKSVRAQDVQTP